MSFIVATLMTYVSPEATLGLFVSLFNSEKYMLQQLYLPGLTGLEYCNYIHLCLMKKYMPKLHDKMLAEGFTPQMYSGSWFMTCFCNYFEFTLVVRILDVYLVEGRKTLFRIALAILKANEEELMKSDMSGMFMIIRDFKQKANLDQLFEIAFDKFTFSKDLMSELHESYEQKKFNPKQKATADIIKLSN